MKKRRTARVLIFDPAGDILLIRFEIPREAGLWVFWAAPGGEIETGETEAEAAARELREELGVDLNVFGPVYVDANQFMHQGEMRENTDYLFVAECAREAPVLTGITADEIAIMKELRWWTLEQLDASAERIFPVNLAARMRELRAGNVQQMTQ